MLSRDKSSRTLQRVNRSSWKYNPQGMFITSFIDVELHSDWDSDKKIATWIFAYIHIPIPWEYVCVPSSGRAASRRAPLAASQSPLGFPQNHFFQIFLI